MSKEATGENGAILGSSEYWDRVNRTTFFGRLMRNASETNYQETLREVGHRAGSAVEEIYDDLQNHIKSVRAISSDRRSSLAKQVQGLYDVCSMAGGFYSHSSDCIGILNLSSFYLPSTSFGDDRAIQNAIHKIKNCSDFFASECIDLVRQAADWSISFAAGSDARKSAFLKDVSQGKGREFLRDVLNAYYSSDETADLRGNCGYSIGSREYRDYMERKVFLQDLPAMSGDDYGGALRDSLTHIANQLQRDLARNERENNYITDETARKLRDAASELGRCGVSVGFADSSIDRLAWFVGGDPNSIRRLQSKLNELRVGEHLTEDGVYGKKTDKVVECFFNQLQRGAIPTIAYLDPLQSKSTQIYSRPISTANGMISSLHDLSARSRNKKGDITVFRADIPDDVHPFYHINTVEGRSIKDGKYVPTSRQLDHLNKWNHAQISDDAYRLLKNFDGVAKKVRIGGSVLLAAGEVLEIIELCQAIEPQLQSADKKLDKKTWSSIASLGGSWLFSAAGAKAGAWAGATIGTAIMPGVGTAIGGVAGGIILGTVGSAGGEWLGRQVVDITVLEE